MPYFTKQINTIFMIPLFYADMLCHCIIKKNMILNHFKQKILIISIPIQNQWKVPYRNLDKLMDGHQTSPISFNPSRFGKLVLCFLTHKHCSIRGVNKTGFIMISVSIHVTIKPVKIMHLNCFLFFFILTPPIKNSSQKCTCCAHFNQS